MELMEGGSLLEYISKNGSSLIVSQRLDLSLQIARGLEHLHKNEIIHRDLAARNCLVNQISIIQLITGGTPLRVKLSDFGLSRNTLNYDSQGVAPIEWTAIEGIISKKFTTSSDIW